MASESKAAVCSICTSEFPSKTQLFRHLEEEHGYESATTKQCKVVLLIGWLSPPPTTGDEWVKEGTLTVTGYEADADAAERVLFAAIDAADNEFCKPLVSKPQTAPSSSSSSSSSSGSSSGSSSSSSSSGSGSSGSSAAPAVAGERQKGYSRCSSSVGRACYLLGVEDGCSRSCDTICYPGRRLQGQNMKAVEAQWVAAVNDKLPPTIRVLMRYTLTSATADFHAECHFTQQVFEYALPLNAVMPKVGTVVIDALAVYTYAPDPFSTPPLRNWRCRQTGPSSGAPSSRTKGMRPRRRGPWPWPRRRKTRRRRPRPRRLQAARTDTLRQARKESAQMTTTTTTTMMMTMTMTTTMTTTVPRS